jgi:hypothetical protein
VSVVHDRGRVVVHHGDALDVPAFVEHMMGLPAGWVTAPAVWVGFRGNARNAQLKALGNGVVPRQAALALRILALWHVAAVSGDASEVDPPSREEVLA